MMKPPRISGAIVWQSVALRLVHSNDFGMEPRIRGSSSTFPLVCEGVD